jgi:hypothetical protein
MALSSGLKLRNHQLESENEQRRIANPRISELGEQDVELRSSNRRLLSSHEIMNIGLDHARAPELTVQALGERTRRSEVINSGLRGSCQTALSRI